MAGNNLPEIKAVDLFCGVGGLTHGLTKAGIEVVAGIDIDPACRYPYEENNTGKFIEKDINLISAKEVSSLLHGADITLLAGCAPCQPFSTYSRSGRESRQNNDWQLVEAFGRLIQKIQPDLVTMENVPQLLKHPVFEKFLTYLDGYSVRWSIIQGVDIGLPQTRKRLVLLASKLGEDALEIEATNERKTVRNAIGKLPSINAGESDPFDPLHTAPRLTPKNLERIKNSKQGGSWRDWPDELRAACHRKNSGNTYPSVYGRMSWDQPSPTITTQCYGYGNGRFGHPVQNRAISLREAAILQSFPLKYKFVPPGASVRFSTLGRLIGNAVPVLLGEAVGKTLIAHSAKYRIAK